MDYLYNSTGYPIYNQAIVRADGCYVYDDAGNAYLDFEAGVWCLPLGHNHPRIIAALQDQALQVCHVGYKYNHAIAERAAKKLVEIADMPDGKCVFLCSGSEAVEYGIQIASVLRPGKRCISLSGQYLSAYGSGATMQISGEGCIPWESNDQKSVEEWYAALSGFTNFTEVGIFIFEAGNSSGLVKLPPANLVSALGILCNEFHILTVVDEVTCGIGRTGKWFGYMNYNMVPDIVAVGKGLGNGYPVSAVILTQKVADDALKAGFHYAQSHQNDPLGCRIALEVIQVIEDDKLLEQSVILGDYLRERYSEIKGNFPAIQEIKGIGLLNSIRFTDNTPPKALELLDMKLFGAGYVVGTKPLQKTLRTYIPLVADHAMIDSFIAALQKCLIDLSDSFA